MTNSKITIFDDKSNFTKSGIVVLDKPKNISSNFASNKVKRILKAGKAGHLGTLDPLGMGVLPITLNKATRLFNYFLQKRKTYRAIFAFESESTTFDLEGEIINKCEKFPTLQELENVLPSFTGKIMQVPPAFSAIKINGKPAYKHIREGASPDLKPREVEIYNIKIIKKLNDIELTKRGLMEFEIVRNAKNLSVFMFEVECSSGTYIRSLCRDIAYACGTFGIMYEIIRTKCGGFDLVNANTFEEIENGNYKFISAFDAIDLPVVTIDEKYLSDLENGRQIICETNFEQFKLMCGEIFWGIAHIDEDGFIKVDENLRD